MYAMWFEHYFMTHDCGYDNYNPDTDNDLEELWAVWCGGVEL